MTVSPIFIFSLPRSGSTLLQRLLLQSSEICSHSETWLLLGLSVLTEDVGVKTVYSHDAQRQAISELSKSLAARGEGLDEYTKKLINKVFSAFAENGEKYFLEKTPRNFYIIDYIHRLYPESKFIFLTRNPRDILASYVKSFADGAWWHLDTYILDFKHGTRSIAEGYKKYQYKSIIVSYEELCAGGTEETLKKIMSFLGLGEIKHDWQEAKKIELSGVMGDKSFIRHDDIKIQNTKHRPFDSLPKILALKYFQLQVDPEYNKLCFNQIEEEKKYITINNCFKLSKLGEVSISLARHWIKIIIRRNYL